MLTSITWELVQKETTNDTETLVLLALRDGFPDDSVILSLSNSTGNTVMVIRN